MTAILAGHGLSYVAVPKIACTSIKTMMFEIENGFPFRPFRASGRAWWIHHFYPSRPFADLPVQEMEDHRRLAVLRDPVRRLLSCYANRVIHHKELSREKAGKRLKRADLPFKPDLSTFIRHLPAYCAAVPSIDHHAAPMVTYLGPDPQFYTRLYRIEEIAEFEADLQRHTGSAAVLQKLQTGGPKIGPDALSPADRAALEAFYASDYASYGAWL